jgi:hypothetical protein
VGVRRSYGQLQRPGTLLGVGKLHGGKRRVGVALFFHDDERGQLKALEGALDPLVPDAVHGRVRDPERGGGGRRRGRRRGRSKRQSAAGRVVRGVKAEAPGDRGQVLVGDGVGGVVEQRGGEGGKLGHQSIGEGRVVLPRLQRRRNVARNALVVGRLDLRPVVPVHLVPVVLARVVRRRHHDPGDALQMVNPERHERRRHELRVVVHRHTRTHKDRRRQLRETLRR